MGYWKTKVLPKIQKAFGKDVAKKAEAIEACKSFDDSKDEVSKEVEAKKEELGPKVLEIIEASSVEIKNLVKDPKEGGIKKHSAKVQKFLDDLTKIEFPGSKAVCEVTSKFGPSLVPGPVIFIFEKVSTFIVTEEKPREAEIPPAVESETPAPATEENTEIVVEEDKSKEEAVVEAETTTPTKEEPPKVEEPVVEQPPKA